MRREPIIAGAAIFLATAASAAEVHVMISAGFHGVYSQLVPAFERATGHHVVTTRGPSMGDSPEAIPTRLARGEPADVVILDGGAADGLAKNGMVRAATKVELARSQIGMVVRVGAAKPDIATVDALRSTLLAAKSIAYSDSGSGTYLSRKLFPKLGIAEQIAGKSRKVRGPPSGEPVAAVVARGEAEIGFQQVSELIHVAGVDYVGAIPAELQPGFTFAGAVTSGAQQPDAAVALLRYLASPEAEAVLVKAGLAPPQRNATEPRGERAVSDALVALERQSWVAWKNHDGKFFDAFLADDHVELGANGPAGKQAVMKFVEGGACNVESYTVSGFHYTRVSDTAAVLVYRAEQKTKCGGADVPSPVWATSVFGFRDGKWRNVLYQHLPTARGAQ
jgi:molybdate transport system substrate-binding protein